METANKTASRVLLHLFRDFSRPHTVTSLAKELHLSRVGMWKVLKRLESHQYILIRSIGAGKTSALGIAINWDNPLVEKRLSLCLGEEAIQQRRWQVTFAELERTVAFLILFGSVVHAPQQAHDVDLIGVAKKTKFVPIQQAIDKVQKTQMKKIHALHFTENEFWRELEGHNRAFIDAVKKGVILFGQDRFVRFMKEVRYG